MPFTVTITKTNGSNDATEFPDQVYQQTLPELDLMKVIQAVNTPPPAAPKPKKPRSDKGITRGPKTAPAATV